MDKNKEQTNKPTFAHVTIALDKYILSKFGLFKEKNPISIILTMLRAVFLGGLDNKEEEEEEEEGKKEEEEEGKKEEEKE